MPRTSPRTQQRLLEGSIGAGVVGRRFPAIREPPFGPQLGDNIAFGVVFALVADRPGRLIAIETDATVPIRTAVRRPQEIGGADDLED